MSKDTGGPAFPFTPTDRSGQIGEAYSGMSLRDYFAIHGDQPGQLEVASAAGVLTQEYSGLKYNDPERDKLPLWNDWFRSLPQDERMDLYAKVRYQIADAMLKARGE